jgi:hypothetical protein
LGELSVTMTLYEFSLLAIAVIVPLLMAAGAKLMMLDDTDEDEE